MFNEILLPLSGNINDYVAHISRKYARHNHLQWTMVGEVSLETASFNIFVHDLMNLLYYKTSIYS